MTIPIEVRLCQDFCQSPHLVQICALRKFVLHETNNILLLYIKNNVVQCIGADATNIHPYTHIHIYTYTYALVQANFRNSHYIYKYDMVATRGLSI